MHKYIIYTHSNLHGDVKIGKTLEVENEMPNNHPTNEDCSSHKICCVQRKADHGKPLPDYMADFIWNLAYSTDSCGILLQYISVKPRLTLINYQSALVAGTTDHETLT